MARTSSVVFDDTESAQAAQVTPVRPISLFDIKRIVTLRLTAFLISFVLAAVVLLPAAWLLTPVTYTARADIRFREMKPRILDSPTGNAAARDSYEKYVNTQAAIIVSNSILNPVLDQPEVQRESEVAAAVDKLKFLTERVRARQWSGTELVTVECTMKNRDSALTILKTVVKQYLDFVYKDEAEAGGERLRILVAEREKRQKDLKNSLDALDSRKAALGLTIEGVARPENLALSLYRESLIRAEEDLSTLQLERSNLETLMNRVRGASDGAAGGGGSASDNALIDRSVETDPRVTSLLEELALAKSRYATLSTRYLESSPQLRKAKDEVASIEMQIEEARTMVRREFGRTKILEMEEQASKLEHQVDEAKARIEKYETLLAEHERRLEEQGAELVKLRQLEDEVAERRTLIDQLSRQITDLSLESQAPARVKPETAPSVPVRPSYAGKLASLLLAFMASGGIGVAVAAVMELRDTTLRSSHDIRRFTDVPVIASIPHTSVDRSLDASEPILFAMGQERSTYADQLRRIFTSVVYPTAESAWVNSLLVTSPTTGDGKTTLACSLAVALAKANRRVLLVDLSHRKPDVEKRFALEPSAGLAEVLNGTQQFEDVVRETHVENLYLIGPGLDSHGLSNRLISEQMIHFQARAEEDFTHVLLDAPPALLMSDASLLAPRVDGVLLVVGTETSNRGMVMRCLMEMERIGAVMLGIVLNGVKPMRGGYFKQHYDLHYGYGQTPSATSEEVGEFAEDRLEKGPSRRPPKDSTALSVLSGDESDF